MKFYKKLLLMPFLLTFVNSCANKLYNNQESIYIVFKTPNFKYADLGFVYTAEDEMKIEIYGSGKALFGMEISRHNICMGTLSCMPKQEFNAKVLSSVYPKSILENIFKAEAIFGSRGLIRKSNGFTQNIFNADKYDIHYRVLNKEVFFHDTINDILIKIKKVDS